MTVTWLVVVCRVPPSPGEELTARCDVVGVAAVPGVEGGVTELSSACFCRVKFWFVFTSLPVSRNAVKSIKVGRLRESIFIVQSKEYTNINVRTIRYINFTRLDTLTALPLLSVRSNPSVLISSLAKTSVLISSSAIFLASSWRKDFWMVS